MLTLSLLIASIALADSANPSTLIPGFWLATAPKVWTLASFTAGVFTAYVAGGLVLLLGPGQVLINALHHLHGPLEHVLEAVGGVAVLAITVAVWRSRAGGDDEPHPRRAHTRASAFALGAGIMTIELPTAFMYFGAISAILAARPTAPVEFLLLATYNAIFIAPLVALVTVRCLAGARVDRWIAATEARVRHVGQLAVSGVTALAGTALLTIGLGGLFVF